ncbi:MAG TPA: right-handed parallel beta-helix repeat-containing protein [Parafilimonas sp.]|nr:right-handed parallel beta-helix repeat-containing protein [Parafilimonas sp.]
MKFLLLFFSIFLIQKSSSQNVATIYISPDGNDNNNGSIDNPVKTIAGLQSLINKTDTKNKVDVYFRKGVYPVTNSLLLSDKNSKASIRFMAYQNEKVSIIGGVNLPGKLFQPVHDAAIIKKISPSIRNHIYEADLASVGINDIGILTNNGFAKPKIPVRIELFINDEPQQLPRWPESGYLDIDRVPTDGNKNAKTVNAFISKGITSQPWMQDSDIWVEGMFSFNWSYDNLKVNKINGNTVFVNNDTKYGIYASGDSSEPLIKAAGSIRGFYFYNMPEELNKAGEWWLDEKNKKIYVYPDADLMNADIKVSLFEKPLLIINNTANISFENIEFGCTRGDVINIKNSSNITFKNCRILNSGLVGIEADNVTNTQISECLIKNTGAENIKLTGGDRKSLNPSGNIIQNCDLSNSSRHYLGHVANTFIGGVGNKIIANYFHDIPSQGIIYEGNNHIIQNNHFENMCYFLADIGGVYTGRNPSATGTVIVNNFFENVRNKRSNYIAAVYVDDGSGGIQASNNLFVNCGSSNAGGLGAIHVNGGANNQFNNNVFINCNKAFSNNVWSDEKWKSLYLRDSSYIKQLTNPNSDIRSSVYTTQYPYLKGFFDSTNMKPRINFINNAICYNVKYVTPQKSSYQVNNLYSKYADNIMLQQDVDKLLKPAAANSWKNWQPVAIQKFWFNTK